MKKTLLLLVLTISVLGYGQIPSYYNDVNLSLSGQALKNELATKITNTHVTFLSYTPGVWDALKQTDLDPTDPSKVLLIYGWNDSDGDITNDRTRGVNDNGGGTGVWNREHVYSKSLANPNLGTEGAGADAHNLRPCDAQRNSSRSNRKFATGSGNSGTTPQGNWYPGDEWKGDVARMMMYMYIRYGDRTLPINVGVGSPVAGDSNMIDLFLQWNAEDPVSDLEKQRNPILEGLQGNRNPFIDNPAFATQVWGGPQAEDLFGSTGGNDTEAPSIPTGLLASNTTITTTQLTWNPSSDNVGVTSYEVHQNGMFLITTTSTNHNVSGLSPNTTYSYTIKAKDASGNTSDASGAIFVTTLDTGAGGNATELFFSEYIEGSSNNKALEIANFTGASVSLSEYKIKKQTNGAGSWSGGITLSGALINGEVFVVANSSATTAIQNEADISTGTSEVTFNGNDAVGLFKNDVLIDIIGTFNGGTANFAQNTTLKRKSSVIMPSTTYEVTEWDTFPQDTFVDLGMHTFDGGSTTDTQAPTVPANLVAANITENAADLSWTASTDNVGVTGYDVYQDGVLVASVTTTNYNATGLAAETAYAFTVTAKDAAGNTSTASNVANVTTTAAPDTIVPTAPTNLVAANITENAADLSWTASTDNVGVTGYDVYQDGVLVASVTTTNYNVTGLTVETAYAFTVTAKDAAGNTSAASNAANVTTTAAPSGGNATDLFFSEYIEGSSFNKALEIANFTGVPIDLSVYTIKKQTNGAGAWSGGLNLTGTLANSDVYIVGHNSSATAIQNVSNVLTASAEITFNGNDAVGLFKNGVLIDIIGTFNGGTANFAKDVTLVRKATVSSPTITYAVAEWDTFATNTFTGLDTHTFNGGGSGSDTQAPTTPASLVAANITENAADLSWTASTDNVGVTGYDVYQDGVLLGSTTTTNYNVVSLSAQTAYVFEVIAKDAANNESLPATVNVTTQGTSTGSTTILHEGFFENGFDGWIDGGSDVSRYSGSRSFEGNYSIRLRDNSGTKSAMTLQNIDVSGYDTVDIEFHFYSYSMENNEDFWVRYHDGSSWITLVTYARGTDFENNNFYSATVTLDKASYNFANNAQFRFQNDASGNGDHIYIDQVSIKGITGNAARATITSKIDKDIRFIRSLNETELETEEDFIIVSNPSGSSSLQVEFYGEGTPSFRIINMLGQVTKTGNLTNNTIDINNLRSGIYILELNDGEEIMSKKFIRK